MLHDARSALAAFAPVARPGAPPRATAVPRTVKPSGRIMRGQERQGRDVQRCVGNTVSPKIAVLSGEVRVRMRCGAGERAARRIRKEQAAGKVLGDVPTMSTTTSPARRASSCRTGCANQRPVAR